VRCAWSASSDVRTRTTTRSSAGWHASSVSASSRCACGSSRPPSTPTGTQRPVGVDGGSSRSWSNSRSSPPPAPRRSPRPPSVRSLADAALLPLLLAIWIANDLVTDAGSSPRQPTERASPSAGTRSPAWMRQGNMQGAKGKKALYDALSPLGATGSGSPGRGTERTGGPFRLWRRPPTRSHRQP